MSDWTYKGVPAPIDDGQARIDMGAWSKGVDAALNTTLTGETFESLLLDRVGYVDAAETTAAGSADNDLAHERAQAVLQFIELVKDHSVPKSLLPKTQAKYALCNSMYYRWDGDKLTLTDKKSVRFLSGDYLDWTHLMGSPGSIEVPLGQVPEWAR